MSVMFQVYERIKKLFFGNKYQKINDKDDDEASADIMKNDCKYMIDALQSFINDAFIVCENTSVNLNDKIITDCLSAYVYFIKDADYKKELFTEMSINSHEKQEMIYKYVFIPYHPKVYRNWRNESIFYNICISPIMLKLTELFNNISVEERKKSIPIETLQYLDT